MNCEWVKENAALYVYDELADDARHELEQHVGHCEACAAELQAVGRLRQELAAFPAAEPSPNLLAASRMRLQEALETAEQHRGWRRFTFDFAGWLQQARLAPALVVLLIMVGFAGGVMATWQMGPGGRSRSAAQPESTDAAIAGIRAINHDPTSNKVEIRYDTLQPERLQGSLDDPRIQQLLLYAARGNFNSGVRLDSIDLLTQNPEDAGVREALIYALRYDKNPGVRLKALEGLREYVADDTRVRDAVVEALLNDSNAGVRSQAITLLAPVRADSSVRQVLQVLAERDDNKFIRQESRRVLSTMPEID